MLDTREGIQLHLEGKRSQGPDPKNSEEGAGEKEKSRHFNQHSSEKVGEEEGGRCGETWLHITFRKRQRSWK